MQNEKQKEKNTAEGLNNKYSLDFNKSFGIIKLGTDIRKILPYFDYIFFRKDSSNKSDWNYYRLKGYKNVSIYTDDNFLIDNIITHTYCFYQGINLIGLNIKVFMKLLNINTPDTTDVIFLVNGGNQHVYDFDEIGLQVWFKYNIIKTIIISDMSYSEDEDSL